MILTFLLTLAILPSNTLPIEPELTQHSIVFNGLY
jgi:hypothetical protein